MKQYSLTLNKQPGELKRLYTALQQLRRSWALSAKVTREINLILDELITNIVEHGPQENDGTIDVLLDKDADTITIQVIDDGPPFDPTGCPIPDVHAPLEKRKCGGLGLLLVRRFADCSRYTRDGDKNIMTITKKLREDTTLPRDL